METSINIHSLIRHQSGDIAWDLKGDVIESGGENCEHSQDYAGKFNCNDVYGWVPSKSFR
jgi:hypothetical protein